MGNQPLPDPKKYPDQPGRDSVAPPYPEVQYTESQPAQLASLGPISSNKEQGGQDYPKGGQYPQGAPPGPISNGASLGQQYMDELLARCAQGQHEWKKEYGCYGIIMAVLLFPFGLICFFMDKKDVCTRCGLRKN